MLSRADRSEVANWWWTIDRFLLTSILLLIGLGIFLSFATSPSIAGRIHISDPFHFVRLHIRYIFLAFLVIMTLSFLSYRHILTFAFILCIISLFLLGLVLLSGAEIKGARRWIVLFGLNLQPSEFIKPAAIVVCAFLFAKAPAWGKIRAWGSVIILLGLISSLLMLEPDVGQTILLGLTIVGMFFLAGLPILWFVLLGGAGVLFGVSSYFLFSHVRGRVDAFLTGEGDTFQIDVGREAIIQGGWFGRGPGEGIIKRMIPDAHTDFVFSVAAEEYGIILCLIIVALYAFIVLRCLFIAWQNVAFGAQETFARLAIAGLAMLFGLQALINMAVNLHLVPPKGMTLPFISYGGSSLLAIGIGMGLLLALTRRQAKSRLGSVLDPAY